MHKSVDSLHGLGRNSVIMGAPLTEPGKRGKRLSPRQKHDVVNSVIAGRSQKDVALDAGLNRRTVSALVKDSLGDTWRDTFHTSKDAVASTIVQAATDQQDIHKAAITGLKLFQGMGLLNGDTPGTVINVLTLVNQALPGDLQFDIVSTDDAIDAQATDSTQEKP